VGRSLGLYPGLWDRFGIIPVGLIRGRLERQVHYLELDDSAIERCGGVGLMEIEEVRISLEERGVDVLGKNNSVLRTQLQSWLRVAKKEGIARLLLTRPTAWEKVR
jgi:GTP cyclohydrolase II